MQLDTVFGRRRRDAMLEHAAEDRCDTGVRSVVRHPRPVDVVVAKSRHRHASPARERELQVLLMDLGRRVAGPRLEPCRLRYDPWLSRSPALGVGDLELTAGQRPDRSRTRPHDSMCPIAGTPLAVRNHAARSCFAPVESAACQLSQQLGGADGVVSYVVWQVEYVRSEAHHLSLMADSIAPAPSSRRGRRAAHVTLDELRVRVDLGSLPMGDRQEHPHLVAVLDQRLDDVRANEAGAAGYKNHVLKVGADREDVASMGVLFSNS